MRIISIVISVVSLLCYIVPVSAAGLPTCSAQSAVLMCAQSGEIIFESNSDEALPMASTTKIMTAVVALENCEKDRIITVGNEILSAEGTMLGLRVGDTIKLYDLVLAMMLSSGNDAANAVAVAVGGSINEFAILMNAYVLELGLTDSNYVTPSGLDAENHYTTAHDLAVLTQYALGIPEFVEICSSSSADIYLNEGSKRLKVYNHNKLLSKYDGSIGVKTGFTKKSGRCLVSAAQRNGVTLIAVTLNDGDDWNDHIRMLDYGFNTVQNCNVFSENETFSVNVVGSNVSSVECYAVDNGFVCPTDRVNDVVVSVYTEHFVYAPLSQGECVGYIEYELDGKVIGKTSICAVGYESCLSKSIDTGYDDGYIQTLIKIIIGWFTDGRNRTSAKIFG